MTARYRADAQVQHEPEPLIPVSTGECESCGAPLDIEGVCVTQIEGDDL